jgi:hypothetical protein
MPLPAAQNARPFYRAAMQRLDDARFLLDKGQRTNTAVYLARYSVECILKAILINSLPIKAQDAIIDEFRKYGQGHDFGWLKNEYRKAGGPPFPPDVQRSFITVSSWETDLRYQTGSIKLKEAEVFLTAAETIVSWADGRI